MSNNAWHILKYLYVFSFPKYNWSIKDPNRYHWSIKDISTGQWVEKERAAYMIYHRL